MSVENPHQNQLVRAKINRIDDSGKLQQAEATGRAREKFGGQRLILRLQPHGLSAVPPEGAHAYILTLNGNPSQALMLGGEHDSIRPKDQAPGDTQLYGHGQFLKFEDGVATMHCDQLIIEADQVIIQSADINLGGLGGKPVAVEGTIDSAGDKLVSAFCTTVKAV